MKAYKIKFVDNSEIVVRFHNTGCVTIIDNGYEHEIGMWKKTDDENWMYSCILFNTNHCVKDWKQKDLAIRIACVWKNRK